MTLQQAADMKNKLKGMKVTIGLQTIRVPALK